MSLPGGRRLGGASLQVQSDSGTLAPYVPRALLARLARQPIDVLTETVEGTMVFADVSGFTRLSERLARVGEEGAEQLVDVINGCFTALLADAYGRGGSLVKFGGDAMLLFFYDDEHTERACSAAAAMRRTLREVGHIRAGPTNVVLRMSVGVHRGYYPMFVVGASHRELLICGAAATTVVEMESAASSGQIVISSRTARRLPRACVGASVGPGFLLARSPSAGDWVSPRGLVAPTDDVIEAFLPASVRTHLLEGSIAPEHRTAAVAFVRFRGVDELITMVFADVSGFTSLLERLARAGQEGAEQLVDLINACFTAHGPSSPRPRRSQATRRARSGSLGESSTGAAATAHCYSALPASRWRGSIGSTKPTSSCASRSSTATRSWSG